jgi:hypothetical protein
MYNNLFSVLLSDNCLDLTNPELVAYGYLDTMPKQDSDLLLELDEEFFALYDI